MPVKPKKSTKADKKEFDEFERVTRWRFDQLRRIGLAPDQAIALIEKPDIVHAAQRLADLGCPPGIIASLLEGD